jgi:hypothetical protein
MSRVERHTRASSDALKKSRASFKNDAREILSADIAYRDRYAPRITPITEA